MTPLLPERAGCPQCGSTDGKRWRSYSGVELCTDCEWDFLSDLNGRKLLDAQRLAKDTSIPRASKSPRVTSIRHNPGNVQHLTTRNLRASRWGGPDALGTKVSLAQPRDTNSICRSCGHIFYGATLSHCLRCRGLCEHRSDHDLTLMGRYAQRFIEAER